VLVDEHLESSEKGVFAAGDIARFPWRGSHARVEHWVHAESQGQTAAKNALGRREPFSRVPFFWSQHYDVPINYVGYAEKWDRVEVAGSIAEKNCIVAYRQGGRIVAVATIYRDRESLLAEDAIARDDQAALEALLK
jgi:NADPH-dependent 2,4-dienoyl-CoA reductase/sulfur reductase-like enzyme